MIYLAFFFGIFTGSFLNVVIYRLKNGRNIIFGRSFCPECKTSLKWPDLMPILSFIWLNGRCRYCRKKISWQYPIVEILSGLIWIGVFNKVYGFHFFSAGEIPSLWDEQFLNLLNPLNLLNFFYFLFIFSALLIIAVYDFKWRIIPNKIVYPAIVAALVFNFFKYFQPMAGPPLAENIETFKLLNFEIWKSLNLEIFKYLNIEIFIFPFFIALIAFLFFFLIYFFSKGRAMGLGDAKLAFLIGLFLSPIAALMAFALAFIIGATFGIILMAISKIPNFPFYQKWAMKSQIAFGPFLVLGAVIVFFFSDFIFKLFNLLNF